MEYNMKPWGRVLIGQEGETGEELDHISVLRKTVGGNFADVTDYFHNQLCGGKNKGSLYYKQNLKLGENEVLYLKYYYGGMLSTKILHVLFTGDSKTVDIAAYDESFQDSVLPDLEEILDRFSV